ncbi:MULTISPECIES: hypothetical protein [Deinococcus]|uniref:Lipoprotein n=1 Tax=Deinococcus rufus TaxID=2136097 RepID=A0ABV7Z8Z7_9DEIO|nr:hypothetical protein [Deinococcus sp. AB2017081]WQE96175.1 hypothetical protein U2P90_04575 [Deinococcus sp. AB2017081]
MTRLLSVPLLAALLVSCGSGVVPSGSGELRAAATTPAGSFAFRCDPAAQGGAEVVIGDDMQFSCPSDDARATLTVLLRTVHRPDPEGGTTDEHVVSAVLTVAAPTPGSYAGASNLTSYTRWLNREFSGTFTIPLSGPGRVEGRFGFRAP